MAIYALAIYVGSLYFSDISTKSRTKAALRKLSVKNKQCTFLDGVPLPDTGDVVATRSIEIINDNDNNGLQSCTFDNVPNPTGGVVKWDHKNTVSYGKDGYGFFCCSINGDESEGATMTTDWTQTISPSGQSIVTCTFDFAGITGEMFDGTLGKQTTYPCHDVYPGLTCCQLIVIQKQQKVVHGIRGKGFDKMIVNMIEGLIKDNKINKLKD